MIDPSSSSARDLTTFESIKMANLTASTFGNTANEHPLAKLPSEIRCHIFKYILDNETNGAIAPLFSALEGTSYLAEARYVWKLTLTPENENTFANTKDPSLKSHLREITLVLPLQFKTTPIFMMNNLEVITVDMSINFDNKWWSDPLTSIHSGAPGLLFGDKLIGLMMASRGSKLYPTDTLRKLILKASVAHEKHLRVCACCSNRFPGTILQLEWIKPLTLYFGFSPQRTSEASGASFTWEVENGDALVSLEQDRAFRIRERKARIWESLKRK